MVDLKVVPSVLKSGVIVPVYKGGGKDPMDVHSYREVALPSVVGKVLEFLILERLQVVLLEAAIYDTSISQPTRRRFLVLTQFLPLRRQ